MDDESARVTTLESSRSTSEEPPTEEEETEPPSFVAESSPNAPAKKKVAAPSVRSAKTFENATNEKAASFSSLPPLDLGDPEKYRRLRETLGEKDREVFLLKVRRRAVLNSPKPFP